MAMTSQGSTQTVINGIETIIYGVEDVALCTRYFIDFGLPLASSTPQESSFELAEGSQVIIRPLEEARTEGQSLVGYGVQKVIYGVSSQRHLEALVAKVAVDRDVRRDPDGTAHFLDDDGIPLGLRVFARQLVTGAPDPLNSHDNIQRLNIHRKWRTQARPKTIQHVVFTSPDPERGFAFYRDRLGFRLSDVQRGFGIFARADGCKSHHTMYWFKADLPFPGLDGKVRFNHTNFGVEDLDEVMTGANYMQRRGWEKSQWGLGRHRIGSSLFLYLPCPAGGEAEYGTDSDALDDSWVPRVWHSSFGTASWVSNLPEFLMDDAPWEVQFHEEHVPPAISVKKADKKW